MHTWEYLDKDLRKCTECLIEEIEVSKNEWEWLSSEDFMNSINDCNFNSHWIKCSDRIPDTPRNVLLANDQFIVIGHSTSQNSWDWYEEIEVIGPITHWMELPEAPK